MAKKTFARIGGYEGYDGDHPFWTLRFAEAPARAVLQEIFGDNAGELYFDDDDPTTVEWDPGDLVPSMFDELYELAEELFEEVHEQLPLLAVVFCHHDDMHEADLGSLRLYASITTARGKQRSKLAAAALSADSLPHARVALHHLGGILISVGSAPVTAWLTTKGAISAAEKSRMLEEALTSCLWGAAFGFDEAKERFSAMARALPRAVAGFAGVGRAFELAAQRRPEKAAALILELDPEVAEGIVEYLRARAGSPGVATCFATIARAENTLDEAKGWAFFAKATDGRASVPIAREIIVEGETVWLPNISAKGMEHLAVALEQLPRQRSLPVFLGLLAALDHALVTGEDLDRVMPGFAASMLWFRNEARDFTGVHERFQAYRARGLPLTAGLLQRYGYALCRLPDEIRRPVLVELRQLFREQPALFADPAREVAWSLACAASLTGLLDDAVAWVEACVDFQYYHLASIFADVDLRPLHGRADFEALRERVKGR